MRLVTFYDDGVKQHPIVINKSKFVYRLDILVPDSITLSELQGGRAYEGTIVLTSVIYDGFAQVKHIAGPQQLFLKLHKELPKDILRELLMDLKFKEDYTFNDGTLLRRFGTNLTAGRSTRLKHLSYTKKAMGLLDNDNVFYSTRPIKTLEEFIETKNLNIESKHYECLHTMDAVKAYVASHDWSKMLGAVDSETSGFKFFYNIENPDKIVGISHSYEENQGVFIQIRYKGAQLLDPFEVMQVLKPILEAPNIYQNGSFDYRVIRTYGVKAYIHWELMEILQLTNPDPSKPKKLKEVARILLGEDTIELDEILGADFDANLVEFIDRDLITFYACGDTDKTLTIAKMLYEGLPEITKKLFEFDMPNYRDICVADWYGFPADKNLLQKVLMGVSQDKLNMENYIMDYINTIAPPMQARKLLLRVGVPAEKITPELITQVMATEEFNRVLIKALSGTRSPKFELDYDADRIKILYTVLDYPKLRFTPTGMLSAGKDYFNDLCNYKLPEPQEIMKQDLFTCLDDVDDKGEKIKLFSKSEINSYAFPLGYMFKEYAIVCNKHKIYTRLLNNYSNGRTFEPYRFTNTATGRLSTAIHTIAGYAKAIIGHTPESEYGLLVFDADQIELRGVHNEAIRMWDNMMQTPSIRDNPDHPLHKYSYESVIKIFNNLESDPHTEMAAQFNHIPLKKVTKVIRKRGKVVAFSGTYGAHSSTMAKGELAFAKTEEERLKILKSYADTKESWLTTNLHLLNYFDITKEEALRPIPEEMIPFNEPSRCVGMTMTRSGRRRFYPMDGKDQKALNKMHNQGRNQFIQSYCRDIIFIAIQNLSKALRESGLSDEEVRGLLYVHDEQGLEYKKSSIHPLWFAAMVYHHCCIEIEGHPIKYYVTPAIVNNWAEGKSDRYEIPKRMLRNLSTNREDYTDDPGTNHRDYMLGKIKEYYTNEMFDIFTRHIVHGEIDLASIDVETRYDFFKRAYTYTTKCKSILPVDELNVLMNYIANDPRSVEVEDISISYGSKPYSLDDFRDHADLTSEFSINELDFESFELYDNMEELEEANQLLSMDDAVASVINFKTVEELNKTYINISLPPKEKTMSNITIEKFSGIVTINLSPTLAGNITAQQVEKINTLFRELHNPQGYSIFYFIGSQRIDSGLKVPKEFDFPKFDETLEKMRRKNKKR